MKKRPEITWSLMHPTPLDPDYIWRLVDKARIYPVDSFEICGQCHSPYGGLDGLIDYGEYPGVVRDRELVRRNRDQMREILRLAHAAGKQVLYFHREVMVPHGLIDALPGLLDENGEFNLLGETFAELIRYKIDRAWEAVPELDGLVLTLTEADYSAIHNSNAKRYPAAEVVRFVIEQFAANLQARGKRFVMRSFGSIAQDYEDILAGARKLAGRYAFEIETKITPYDFDPFLPVNPYLKRDPAFSLGVECESVGEFMGQGNLPMENVDNHVAYVRAGIAAGADRFVIRVDRRGNDIFSRYEINYYAYARALQDGNATADDIRREWSVRHVPEQFRAPYAELDRMGWEMVTKTYFIDRQVLFHGNYAMKYLKAGFVFALFGRAGSLERGDGIWSILTDRAIPSRTAILAEKDRAVELADAGNNLLSRCGAPEDDWRWRLWDNARIVTRAVRELVRCIVAYFEAMESPDRSRAALDDAVELALREFDRLAGHPIRTVKHEVINGLEHRMREIGLSMEELCLEPLAAICRELPVEFDGECAARRKFLNGVADGVLPGAITDDGRVRRYMHASHAALYKNLPARWAGNRVFPNGYFEIELVRGGWLKIFGETDETCDFTLVCDGVSHPARFSENGEFIMPLMHGKPFVTVRIAKNGAAYPRIYAVVTVS